MVVAVGTAVGKSLDKLKLVLVCCKGEIFTNRYRFTGGGPLSLGAHRSVNGLIVAATKKLMKG